MSRPIKTLLFSTLFPSTARPVHGIFVETRLRELLKTRAVETKVVAPVDGIVETQIVSPGDYVKVGDPLFRLVSNRVLRAHLPFPEAAAARIRAGQPVRRPCCSCP